MFLYHEVTRYDANSSQNTAKNFKTLISKFDVSQIPSWGEALFNTISKQQQQQQQQQQQNKLLFWVAHDHIERPTYIVNSYTQDDNSTLSSVHKVIPPGFTVSVFFSPCH